MRNWALGRPYTSTPAANGSYPDRAMSVLRSGDADWTSRSSQLTDGYLGRPNAHGGYYNGWNSGTPVTVLLDLEQAVAADVFRVWGWYGGSGINRPLQGKLEYSDNGTTFTTVADRSGLAAGGQPGARQWMMEFDISALGAHRYWRTTFTRDGEWLFVGELEVVDATSENVALGRAVTYSTAPSTYTDPLYDQIRVGASDWSTGSGSMLTDGEMAAPADFDLGYVGITNAGPVYTLSFDLGTARAGAVWQATGATNGGTIGRPTRVQVEWSDDNSAWTSVINKTGLTASAVVTGWIVELDISAAGSHRYWRLTFERYSTWIFLSELAMWT